MKLRRLRIAIILTVFAALWPPGAGQAAAGSGLELPMVIELRDLQQGFAGTTGTLWRIGPDGSYTVANLFNETESPPLRSGRLDEAQRSALAAALARHAAADLPAELGADIKVNPRLLILTLDGRPHVLTLPPGPAVPTPAAGTESERLLAVATAIKAAVGPQP